LSVSGESGVGGEVDRAGAWLPIAIAGVAAFAVAVLAAIYLFLAHPSADDFCRAGTELGAAVKQTLFLYQHHVGRWVVSLLHAWMQPRIGINGIGYSLALAAVMIAWFSAFLLGAGLVLGREAPRRLRWFLALLLFAIFWAGSPGQAETFYWLSGSVDYGLPFLLLMIGLRLLASIGGARQGPACAAGFAAVGFIVSGTHEFVGMLLLGAALLRLAMLVLQGLKREAGYLLLGVCVTAAGLALVALAPGNAERASHFPMRGNIGRALGQTFRLGEAPLEWLLDIRLLALSALLLTLPAFRSLRPHWLSIRVPWLVLLPVGTLAAILATHALAAYVIGFPPPARMLSLLYGLFILCWTASLVALGARLRELPRPVGGAVLLPAGAACAFAASLLVSSNTVTAARGLRHDAAPWLAQNAQQRESARLQIAAGGRDLVLPVITTVPHPLMKQGLADDPRWWFNRCLADYLEVDSTRAPPGQGNRARRVWRGER
jgi:hypothetical protein